MQHPIIAQANAKVRYDEFIQQADQYRLINSLPNKKQSLAAVFSGLFRLFKSETIHTATSKTTA
jgi:hypothetical protein